MKGTYATLLLSVLCSISLARGKSGIADELGELFAKELSEHTKQLIADYTDLKGSVKLSITVDKAGYVALVKKREDSLDDTEPLAGIMEKVYGWKFTPLQTDKKRITFEHSVSFSDEIDSTRVFFIIMGVLIAVVTALVIVVRAG
jgi:hypothetical protein